MEKINLALEKIAAGAISAKSEWNKFQIKKNEFKHQVGVLVTKLNNCIELGLNKEEDGLTIDEDEIVASLNALLEKIAQGVEMRKLTFSTLATLNAILDRKDMDIEMLRERLTLSNNMLRAMEETIQAQDVAVLELEKEVEPSTVIFEFEIEMLKAELADKAKKLEECKLRYSACTLELTDCRARLAAHDA